MELWSQTTVLLGWAHVQAGRADEGLEEMREGLAAWLATGKRVLASQLMALLAEGRLRAGRIEEGLGTIAEALEHVERSGERHFEPELHRLKGELLLQQNAPESEADASFQRAIAVARGQEARSWELRATVSLARLWQRQGKSDDARQVLSAIYGWFTEGFDTPDLQEARALLEELSADEGHMVKGGIPS